MKTTADIDHAVEFMRTLAAQIRIELLMLLCRSSPATPADMLKGLAHRRVSATNLSEHLRFLSRKRLVKVKRVGRNIFYEIDRARARVEIARLNRLAQLVSGGARR